jgi:hypothetical protein
MDTLALELLAVALTSARKENESAWPKESDAAPPVELSAVLAREDTYHSEMEEATRKGKVI